MLKQLYERWMYAWETKLTMQDTNRVVRPLEWGFDWLEDWIASRNLPIRVPIRDPSPAAIRRNLHAAMLAMNESIIADSEHFYGYKTPSDFRLEERHPLLFPTNVRPETLRHDAELKRLAAEGRLPKAQFLRFTSALKTPYPENDQVNARWYPAPPEKQEASRSKPSS